MLERYAAYLKDNPHGYWFKRRLFGWGWVPVRWQGWMVLFIGLGMLVGGVYVSEVDDAPGAALMGALLMIALMLVFGFWKGESPRWQWGLPKEDEEKAGER